jgi:hypothetical protein
MKRAVIGPEMVCQGFIGMAYGNFVKRRIPAQFGGFAKHFKVHHVIDNDRILPVVPIPRFDQTYFWVEPAC